MRTWRSQSGPAARWRIAIAAAVAFAGLILFSFSGLVLSSQHLNQQAEALRQSVQELKTENQRLQKEADYLRSDEGLEKLAREELGWVKPGEVAIVTIPSKTEERSSVATTVPQSLGTPNWQRWWNMFFGR